MTINKPTVVQIEITNKCNLKCIHCYASSGNKKSYELTTNEIKKLISELYDSGTTMVLLTGGEPLLHPDFLELCKTVRSYGLELGINSNGILLTNEMARELKCLDLKLFSISLHGIKKDTHDAICGKDSYDNVIKSINIAMRQNLPLRFSSMISKINYKEIPQILEYALLLGIKGISVFRFLSVGRGINSKTRLHIDNNLHKIVVSDLLRIASNNNLIFRIEAPYVDTSWQKNELIESVPCLAGIEICTVTSEGDIIGCNGLRNLSSVAGNVRKTEFNKIWLESEFFNELRRFNKNWEKLCPNCEKGSSCGGGCRAASVAEYQNVFTVDPYCHGCESDFSPSTK